MAKLQAIPTASNQTGRVVRQIIKLLQESRTMTHFSRSEHFTRSVCLWEATLRRAEMGEWLELCHGMERGMTPLAEALGLLRLHAASSFEDVPGLIYMELGLGDVDKGQYFTPFNLAKAMVELMMPGDFKPPGPGDPPFTIYDPACGSGIMFLAAMEWVDSHHPECLDRGDVEFFGQDIDHTAVMMCRLNFRLRGIPRMKRESTGATMITRSASQKLETTPALTLTKEVVPSEDYLFF